jgi:hypothetical protein
MVIGLDLLKEHFRPYADRYVLIGGTACELALEEAGFSFRATRDLDIVLCIEALDRAFVEAFWEFIRVGQYEVQQKATGSRQLYRFIRPGTRGSPFMLELFSRAPDMLRLADDSHLTPIPTGEEVASLSAILLDDDYYRFLLGGKKDADGLSFVGPEHLIPLKARAWLDLTKRKERGEDIDSKDIKKYKNDVVRLYPILNPDFGGAIPRRVKDDLREFISRMRTEQVDFESVGLRAMSLDSVLRDIQRIYALG